MQNVCVSHKLLQFTCFTESHNLFTTFDWHNLLAKYIDNRSPLKGVRGKAAIVGFELHNDCLMVSGICYLALLIDTLRNYHSKNFTMYICKEQRRFGNNAATLQLSCHNNLQMQILNLET